MLNFYILYVKYFIYCVKYLIFDIQKIINNSRHKTKEIHV